MAPCGGIGKGGGRLEHWQSTPRPDVPCPVLGNNESALGWPDPTSPRDDSLLQSKMAPPCQPSATRARSRGANVHLTHAPAAALSARRSTPKGVRRPPLKVRSRLSAAVGLGLSKPGERAFVPKKNRARAPRTVRGAYLGATSYVLRSGRVCCVETSHSPVPQILCVGVKLRGSAGPLICTPRKFCAGPVHTHTRAESRHAAHSNDTQTTHRHWHESLGTAKSKYCKIKVLQSMSVAIYDMGRTRRRIVNRAARQSARSAKLRMGWGRKA